MRLRSEEFVPPHRISAFADLSSEGLCGHQKCSSKVLRGFFLVNIGAGIKYHVAKLVSHCEALSFAPVTSVDHNYGRRASCFTTHPRRQTVKSDEIHSEHLDATLLEQFDQVGNGVQAQSPVPAKSTSAVFSL